MRRSYEDEFRFTLKKHVEEFKQKVRVVIESSEEKREFYDALKNYHIGKSVQKLVTDLKPIINTPKRHPLFREVRYLVRPNDVPIYTELIPAIPSEGMRTIKLQRVARETLGFNVRGGKEHGTGVFITLVMRGCQADIVGLKPGDEILSINGFQLSEATHEEVVNLLKTRRNLLLKVKSTGKVPRKIHDVITWETVENKENVYYHPDLLDFLAKEDNLTEEPDFQKQPDDKEITMVVGPKGMGCSIRNGIPGMIEGLFVVSVIPGGLAEKSGARVGDQVMAVNGNQMEKIPYSEAVSMMKAENRLTLILRHCKEAEEWIMAQGAKIGESLPEFAIKTRLLSKKAEEKQKREKLSRERELGPIYNDNRLNKEAGEITATGDQISPNRTHTVNTNSSGRNSKKMTVFEEIIKVIDSAAGEQPPISSPSSRGISPALLNPSNVEFSDEILEGREARFHSIEKICDLKMVLEEREGKIFVKSVEEGGSIAEHGGIHAGDQLLNVEGTSLLGVTLEEAEQELKRAMDRRSETIDVVIAVSGDDTGGNEYKPSSTCAYQPGPLADEEVYDTRL